MGQDGKDREGGDPGLNSTSGPPGERRSFRREIRTAERYERGLFVKALFALALVAVIVVIRTLYLG